MGAAAWLASVMKGEGEKNPRRAFLHLARAFARPGRSSKVHDGQVSNMMVSCTTNPPTLCLWQAPASQVRNIQTSQLRKRP
jgi:hypothetical protein